MVVGFQPVRTRSISTLREDRSSIFLGIFGGHLEGDNLASSALKFREATVLGIFAYCGVWLVSQ